MPTRPIAPLLVEPAPPHLESQAAVAQGADGIAELAQWRYRLRYRAEHAAQDEVLVTASFNLPPSEDASAAADAPQRSDWRYRVQLDYSDDGEWLQALQLTRAPDAPWPEVDYRASSDAPVEPGEGDGDDTTRRYVFDPPLPQYYWPGIGLTWNRLAVAALQNAQASLTVVRNGNLGQLVTEEQIYRSASSAAAADVSPLNRWTQDIAIDDLGEGMAAALEALFARLFGERRIGQRVMLQVQYGFPLTAAASDAALMSYVPVVLMPVSPITATTAAELVAALDEWKNATAPPTDGSEWVVSLVQFSQLDTERPQPLLDVARFVYRL